MQLKSIIASFLLLFCSISFAQTQINAYPTHWWVGMKNPKLQLMLHADSDLSKNVRINKAGISIQKIFQPENKHYLFIDINITPAAKPGMFSFTFQDGKSINYELKTKSSSSIGKVNQGVNASDLIYLIMPDRFVNGDASNDQFPDLRDKDVDRKNPYVRHGGDLAGVSKKLDYLKNLGVTSLWMTPLLENNMPKMQEGPYTMSGYHGYWITDHYKIDKRFGGNDAYKNMVKAAHEKGLKVIQDAVYNHVGSFHHTVLDLPMKDWLNQWPAYTGSNHREELFIDPHASSEEKKIMIGGWFVPHLPDLNLANPYCANFIIQSNIWSTQEFGIDGWRVDTYKYCDEKFLNNINAAIIKEFPAITVFGEAWTNSVPASAYFTQNNIDAPFTHQIKGVTDFPLNSAMFDALNQPFGWTEGISKLYMTLSQDFLYKDPMTNCIFLDNHDMNRFYSMVEEDLSRYKMGLGLLFTLRGIPQVYYGTESLAKNYKNPNDAAVRKDFPGGWSNDSIDKFDISNLDTKEKEAFVYFQKLANFRKTSIAISKGSLKQFIPQNGIYVYFRIHEKQTLMCVVNTNATETNVMLDRFSEVNSGVKRMKNALTEQTISVDSSIKIPSKSFQLFELIK
jgi:glycosidase